MTFNDVCHYAELSGCPHREDPSRAKDLTQKYYWSPWRKRYIMVLYEAPRRILRGGTSPEVCWWCIDSDGGLSNEASRNLRLMDEAKGIGISDVGAEKILRVLNNEKINKMEDENNV